MRKYLTDGPRVIVVAIEAGTGIVTSAALVVECPTTATANLIKTALQYANDNGAI